MSTSNTLPAASSSLASHDLVIRCLCTRVRLFITFRGQAVQSNEGVPLIQPTRSLRDQRCQARAVDVFFERKTWRFIVSVGSDLDMFYLQSSGAYGDSFHKALSLFSSSPTRTFTAHLSSPRTNTHKLTHKHRHTYTHAHPHAHPHAHTQ